MLVEYGMFKSQAKEVVELAVPKLNELLGFDIKFDHPTDHYPDAIINTLFVIMKPIVVEWIDENKPMAWYRPMFT